MINRLSLLMIAAFIFYESYKRFISPPQIDVPLMLLVAGFGLAGNVLMALGISHILLQFECAECENGGLYCQID